MISSAKPLDTIATGLLAFVLALLLNPQAALGSLESKSADADRVRASLQEALDGGRFQSDLPFASADKPNRSKAERPASAPAGPLGSMLSVLAWVVIGVVVVLIVMAIAMTLFGRSTASRDDAAPARTAAGAAVGRVAYTAAGGAPDFLSRAEELAAAGHYPEAVHLMLLGAIERLSQTAALRCRSSQTSRELLGAFDAEPGRRTALQNLVVAVERSLFGGRPLGSEHVDACRGYLQILQVQEKGTDTICSATIEATAPAAKLSQSPTVFLKGEVHDGRRTS